MRLKRTPQQIRAELRSICGMPPERHRVTVVAENGGCVVSTFTSTDDAMGLTDIYDDEGIDYTVSVSGAAVEYIGRGWRVVPIPFKRKGPVIKGWPQLTISASEVDQYFPTGKEQNIGVILGDASGGLVDIDLDCPEACDLADQYLPPTGAEFGHGDALRSHRLYYAVGSVKSCRVSIDRVALLEMRANGCQTVFPGSIHPNGDPIVWATESIEPATIDHVVLSDAFERLASVVRGC